MSVYIKVEAQMKPRTVLTSKFNIYARRTLSPHPIQNPDQGSLVCVGNEARSSCDSGTALLSLRALGKVRIVLPPNRCEYCTTLLREAYNRTDAELDALDGLGQKMLRQHHHQLRQYSNNNTVME
jgi:hypothetical protein